MLERLKYNTDLPVSQCLDLLRRTSDAHPWSLRRLWSPLPEGTIESTVCGRRFLLSAWPAANTHNSFAPVFYGVARPGPGGTTITGRFLFHPVVLVFLAGWFGCALFGLIVALYLVPSTPGRSGGSGLGPLGPVLLTSGVLAAGSLIVGFGIRLGRNQRRAIEDYLRSVLHARPATGGVAL